MAAKIVLFLILGVSLFGWTGCATQRGTLTSAAEPASATIRHASGHAEIASKGAEWKQAARGATVQQGDRVRTGATGTLSLDLGANGGIMEFMPNSEAEFERLGPTASDPDVVAIIALTAGRVVGDTMNPPGRGKVLVRTQAGTHTIE